MPNKKLLTIIFLLSLQLGCGENAPKPGKDEPPKADQTKATYCESDREFEFCADDGFCCWGRIGSSFARCSY